MRQIAASEAASARRRVQPKIAAVNRLSDQITDQMEAQILHGDLRAGEKLPTEAALCDSFRVSRSVIRSALRSLDARGLIEARAGIGTVIREPNDEALSLAVISQLMRSDISSADVMAARAAVDESFVPFAAERATSDQIEHVSRSLDAFKRAIETEDWDACSKAHVAFHVGLIRAINTPALSIILISMQHIIMLSTLPESDQWHRTWVDELPLHTAIADALIARDVDALRVAVVEHYKRLRGDPRGSDVLFRDSPGVIELLESRSYRQKN